MLTPEQIERLKVLADDMKKATGQECEIGLICETDGGLMWVARIGRISEPCDIAVSRTPELAICRVMEKWESNKAARISDLESELAALKGK